MSTKNLYSKEAKEKLTDIVENVKVAMFATNLNNQPLSVIPMHTKKVDDAGNIWFISLKNSDHNLNIQKDEAVQLMYSDPNSMKFISIYGKAQIINDTATIKDLYSRLDNAWFDGPEDPKATAIKVVPEEAAYWSNDHNKLVTLFKLGVAAVTGDNKDIGTSGKMKI